MSTHIFGRYRPGDHKKQVFNNVAAYLLMNKI